MLDGNVLGNDVQGADGAAVTAGTLTGTYGSLVLGADGSYTYTPVSFTHPPPPTTPTPL
ncbi:VCBS domain-containing protein [Aeromonas salmonicida]|uniref:VCBS domain-containing protein n=1 Tax=Aeromonas salmonicida TaxID=645 RepID=UPI003D30FAD6